MDIGVAIVVALLIGLAIGLVVGLYIGFWRGVREEATAQMHRDLVCRSL